jgi:hypothetical protein
VNIPKLFEGAIARAIIEHAALIDMPRIRTWQAVDSDARWSPDNDLTYPLLDIRGGPPRVSSEDGATCLCNLTIVVATAIENDRTHAQLARYYEAVQTVLDALYAQFRADQTGAERQSFDAHLSDNLADGALEVGGFEHGDALDPYTDEGGQFIGWQFVVHFSRPDF